MRRWRSLSTALAVSLAVATFSAAGHASGTAVPSNETPPTISGTMVEGNVLGADHGRWHGNKGGGFGYQWRRCLADGTGCADIPGATDRIYALGAADVGHVLRVVVTASNHDGSAPAISDATPTVAALAAAAPHAGAPPVISGSAVQGRVVVASTGTWTGTAPLAFAFRWRRCSATGGDCDELSARSRAYRLSSDDVNHTLRILVVARGTGGIAAALSGPTARIVKAPPPAAPQNRSLPRIQGLAQQGQQLRGDRGGWANAPSSFGFTWLRCDRNGNACGVI